MCKRTWLLALLLLVIWFGDRTQAGTWEDQLEVTVIQSNDSVLTIQFTVDTSVVYDTWLTATRSFILPSGADPSINIVDSHSVRVPRAKCLATPLGAEDVEIHEESLGGSKTASGNPGERTGELVVLIEPYIQKDYEAAAVFAGLAILLADSVHVYTTVTVDIEFNATGGFVSPDTVAEEFDRFYEARFLNYGYVRAQDPPELVPGEMLILCCDQFADAMAPFVEWKRQKGIATSLVGVPSSVSNDTLSIMSYLQGFSANHELVWVLLVGDSGQVRSFRYVPESYSPSFNAISDPRYALLQGNDYRPDVFIGRFSSEDTTDVITQVNRTLQYECFPEVADWWSRALVAGRLQTRCVDLLSAGDMTVSEIVYDSTDQSSQIDSVLENGCGVVVQAGHGFQHKWNWPNYERSDVNALQNVGKLPVIVGSACLVGKYDSGNIDCFAEAWLHASDGSGNPTGAVATFMASEYNSNGYLTNRAFAQYAVANAMNTFGGMCYAAVSGATDHVYGSTQPNDCDAESHYCVMHVFGDPSLCVRTDTPTAMSVSHDTLNPCTASQLTVHVDGIARALCALFADTTIYGTGYTNSSGNATIQIESQLPTDEPILLTVTAFNKLPYIDTLWDDPDGDSIITCLDNCPVHANPGQEDTDEDGIGDICDNCVYTANSNQTNSDADVLGDACDNCPEVNNPGQEDLDEDGTGDACDDDLDGDGVSNGQDNCPYDYNPDQADSTGNGIGDVCDCCVNSTGNVDCDPYESVDMADLTVLIDHLMISLTPLCCEAEADVDLSGMVDMGDVTILVDHLFGTLAPLPACP